MEAARIEDKMGETTKMVKSYKVQCEGYMKVNEVIRIGMSFITENLSLYRTE
jgi:hypothetical protein